MKDAQYSVCVQRDDEFQHSATEWRILPAVFKILHDDTNNRCVGWKMNMASTIAEWVLVLYMEEFQPTSISCAEPEDRLTARLGCVQSSRRSINQFADRCASGRCPHWCGRYQSSSIHNFEHNPRHRHVLFDLDDVGARLVEAELAGARGVARAQTTVAEQHDERDDHEAHAERRERRADRDRHRLPRAAQHPARRAGRRRGCARVRGAYEFASFAQDSRAAVRVRVYGYTQTQLRTQYEQRTREHYLL